MTHVFFKKPYTTNFAVLHKMILDTKYLKPSKILLTTLLHIFVSGMVLDGNRCARKDQSLLFNLFKAFD